MYYQWNRSQYKYNQHRYKSENQNCVYWPIIWSYNNWKIIHCVESRKEHKSSDTDINVFIKHNSIRNIDLNIGKYISEKNYESFSAMDKNTGNGYYIVKRTIDSYTMRSSHKIGRDVIKSGELMCDAVYLKPFANFSQWYNTFIKNERKQLSY